MTRLHAAAALALSLLLSTATAGTVPIVVDGRTYTVPDTVTPAQRALIVKTIREQTAPPELVGRTLREAVTVLINERTAVNGVTAQLPRELLDALSRAALVGKVTLVTGPRESYTLPRVTVAHLQQTPTMSMIATSEYVVVVRGTSVLTYRSVAMAQRVAAQVQAAAARSR